MELRPGIPSAARRGLAGTLGGCLLSAAGLVAPADAAAVELPYARGEDLTISLLTVGPGDAVNTFFGHNGFVVEDRSTGTRALYHYGNFSFGPDMLARYLRGHLLFSAARVAVAPTVDYYASTDRDVRLAELRLPAELKLKLARRLEHDIAPANRDYVYHHYFDNCSTKLRDLVDELLGGALREALSDPAPLSLREHTRRYAQVNPVVDLALLLWMNDDMEQPIERWHETFLPDVLEARWAEFRYSGDDGREVPLLGPSRTLFASSRPRAPERPAPILPWVLLASLSFSGSALVAARLAARRADARAPRIVVGLHHAVAGLVLGVPGTLGFLMAFFTEHTVTHANENLLFCNALTLVALPLGIGAAFGSARATRWLAYVWVPLAAGGALAVACKVLPAFDQANAVPIALVVPVNWALAAVAVASRRRQSAAPVGSASR